MSSLKENLKKANVAADMELSPESNMKALISRVFATRNALHFFHWKTKSFAAHMAVGDLYDAIVDKVDDIVEIFQGKYGLLEGVSCPAATAMDDPIAHVRSEAEWFCDNKQRISGGNAAVNNLLDDLEGCYLKTIYKLENLH